MARPKFVDRRRYRRTKVTILFICAIAVFFLCAFLDLAATHYFHPVIGNLIHNTMGVWGCLSLSLLIPVAWFLDRVLDDYED